MKIEPKIFEGSTHLGLNGSYVRDTCYHCGAAIGEAHKEGSVCRRRTVVVQLKTEVVIDVPEDWTSDHIYSWANEGSWCSGNILSTLDNQLNDDGCLCSRETEITYLREATPTDHERLLASKKSDDEVA